MDRLEELNTGWWQEAHTKGDEDSSFEKGGIDRVYVGCPVPNQTGLPNQNSALFGEYLTSN